MKNYILVFFCSILLSACDITTPSPNNTTTSDKLQSGIPNWPSEIKEGEIIPKIDNQFATNIILAIDTSGSMESQCNDEEKFASAIKASQNFLVSIPENANIGLIKFGGGSQIITQLTSNKLTIKNGITSLRAGGGTPMASAIQLANEMFNIQGKAQGGNGQYHLVILGDGDPDSQSSTASWLDFIINKTPIQVHAIGFCAVLSILDRDDMAYKTANNASELQSAFAEVLAEEDLTDDSADLGSW